MAYELGRIVLDHLTVSFRANNARPMAYELGLDPSPRIVREIKFLTMPAQWLMNWDLSDPANVLAQFF